MFLDQICINQTDLESKANGVLHMGAFLKKSKSMLVLWDPTFVQRLWCMFELAAFLKSHEDEKHKHRLSVRPIFLGPCTFAIAGSHLAAHMRDLHAEPKHSSCESFDTARLLDLQVSNLE